MAAERALVLLLVAGCVVEHKLGDVDLEDGGMISATGTSVGETSASASISSTSAGDSTGGSEVTSTGGFDPYAQCGVVLEYGGPNQQWTCGCETCEINQHELTDESRDVFLGACACLCDAFGCGGSTTVTTGATTEEGSSGSSTTDATTGTTSESTGGSTETTSDTG
ncbi:MAG TPA: hypothetical protein VG755_10710 [Nannocystaceae bacterium]|nr:hypothetical protein [Nannocystaceae bacterium]